MNAKITKVSKVKGWVPLFNIILNTKNKIKL